MTRRCVSQHGGARASTPWPSRVGVLLLVDWKQLAAVCRIKALWRLRCCALAVCGFREGDRWTYTKISTPVPVPRVFSRVAGSSVGELISSGPADQSEPVLRETGAWAGEKRLFVMVIISGGNRNWHVMGSGVH